MQKCSRSMSGGSRYWKAEPLRQDLRRTPVNAKPRPHEGATRALASDRTPNWEHRSRQRKTTSAVLRLR